MSRYLYKKIQNISPESLNFQHSGLKLTTLGYDGKLQYAVLESDTRDAHIQLVQQNYPKDTIWREFADSGLDSMACIYSEAIKKELIICRKYYTKHRN